MNNKDLKKTAANEAWQQMKELLDTEMPADLHNGNRTAKYSVVLLLLLIGSCGIYKWLEKDITPNAYSNIEKIKIHKHNIVSELHDPTSESNNAEREIKLSKANDGKDNTKKRNVLKEVKRNTYPEREIAEKNDAAKKVRLIKKEYLAATKSSRSYQTIMDVTGKSDRSNSNDLLKDGSNKTITTNPQKNNKAKADDLSSNDELIKNNNNLITDKAEIKPKVSSSVPIADTKQMVTTFKKTTKIDRSYMKHYGLQWNMPLQVNNTTIFTLSNSKNNPLTLLIPSFWISKDLSQRSLITVSVNPNTQYFLNNRATFVSGNYSLSSVSGSNINQPPTVVTLTQNNLVSKVMGVETSVQYEYNIGRNFNIGAVLAGTQTTGAVFKEIIIKNSRDVIKDSAYGVVRADDDWRYVHSLFATGKLTVAYTIKRYQIGAALTKAITPVYKSELTQEKPVNVQLYLRWMMR